MAIKKRKNPIRKRRISPGRKHDKALARMGELAESGLIAEDGVTTYLQLFFRDQLKRLQSIAAIADKNRNWDHMAGCYKQASELYVLASVLYEKFPAHVIMTDGAFDGLARWLNKHWHEIDDDFKAWYNITSIDLSAGTGMNVITQPPIRWMVQIHTGTDIGDGKKSQNRKRRIKRKRITKRKKVGRRVHKR